MKIKRTAPKKLVPPSDAVQAVIDEIIACPQDTLTNVLVAHSKHWPSSHTDLFYWINVLDKLDSLLQQAISLHRFDLVQHQEFTPEWKALICAIMLFTRHLIEHSFNRYVYSSYEHLNTLLLTTDLEVLDLTLRLLYCFSYRFGGKSLAKSNAYTVNLDILKVLARCEPSLIKDRHSIDYLYFCSDLEPEKVALNWGTMFSFQFYRQSSGVEPSNEMPVEPASGSDVNGLVLIKKPKLYQVQKSCIELANDLINQYRIPDEYRFSLFHRIRIVREVFNNANRYLLLSIRFLALGILCPYLDNSPFNFHTEIFQREPNFLHEIASLISVANPVPSCVRSSATQLFDSLIRNRAKITDALAALNFGAFHGVLSQFFKFVLQNVDKDGYALLSEDFIEGIFNIATYLVSSQSGGSSIVSSGIIPLLVDLVEANGKYDCNAELVRKCIFLLDNILYSFPNVFSQFQSAEGVSKFVQEISRVCIKAVSGGYPPSTDTDCSPDVGNIVFPIRMYLKALLNSILRLMQSSGTVDGLRNLIETTLPASLTLIFQNLNIIGSDAYAPAISILATFINNEPTALSILLEMNLPQAFIQSISQRIPASYEVINATFLALGAVCLNSLGLQLVEDSEILSKLLSVLTQREYLRMLQKTDCATAIGAGFDELIRHHPNLRERVFTEIVAIHSNITNLAPTINAQDERTNCSFLLPDPNVVEPDEVMVAESFPKVEHKDALMPQFIEAVCIFLEAFLQSEANKRQFIEMGGFARLIQIYHMCALPYDFSSSVYSFSLFHLFKVLLEFQPDSILQSMLNDLHAYLTWLYPFTDYKGEPSYFLPAVYAKSSEELTLDLKSMRQVLVAIHGISSLLTDVFSTRNVSSRLGLQLLASVFDDPEKIKAFNLLWKTYNCCTWEFHRFKRSIPQVWLNKPKRDSTTVEELSSETEPVLVADPNDRRIRNMKTVKYLLTQIPTSFIPLTCKISELVGDGKANSDSALVQRKTAAIEFLVSSLENSFRYSRSLEDVGTWFDYIGVILGHTLVLFFEELDAKQIAINIATLEHFVRKGMQCLDDTMAFALANAAKVDEKTLNSTFNAFVALAIKFVDIELLRSLEFVHPTDAEFIIKLRLKGLIILMQIWKSPVFNSLSLSTKTLMLSGFRSVLFNGPYYDTSLLSNFEPPKSSIDDLTQLGFPPSLVRQALVPMFGTTTNDIIIYLVTNQNLLDEHGNPLSPATHALVAEFKRTFLERVLPILSEPVSNSFLETVCSLLRQIFDTDFEPLYATLQPLLSFDTKLRILSMLAPEKQGYKVSPLAFLCSKLGELFALASSSNYVSMLSIIEALFSHEENVPQDSSDACIEWLQSVISSRIESDLVLIALLRCAVVVNKRYANRLDVTAVIAKIADCPVSNQLAPSVFSLAAILCHMSVQNDLYDSQLFDQMLDYKMAGKFDKLLAITTGLEYAMKINAQVFREVAHKKVFVQHHADANDAGSEQLQPKTYARSQASIESERTLITFLLNSLLYHKHNDIFQRICLLLLSEMFHSYQSSVQLLIDESVPLRQFLSLLLKEFIPFSGLIDSTNELKSDDEKSMYFRSFLSQFLFVLLINECGLPSSETIVEQEAKDSSTAVSSTQSILDSSTVLRKVILDSFFKIFREVFHSTSLPLTQRYGAVQAYSDLLHRLLSSKLSKKSTNATLVFTVKYCIEKKVLAFLCQSLKEADVNYPRSFLLFNALLKPVEFLTKVTNKINLAKRQQNQPATSSQKIPADYPLNLTDNEMSEVTSDEDDEDEMSDGSFEMMDDELVYGTDEEDYDSEMDESDEMDDDESAETEGSDQEIIIRPHAPIYSEDDEETEMETEDFFRPPDHLDDFDGPIDIVIEERLEDDNDFSSDHEGRINNHWEGHEFNPEGLGESETESNEDYIVYEGDEDFVPMGATDDQSGLRRNPVHLRSGTLANGSEWITGMTNTGDGVIRLDWRIPDRADLVSSFIHPHQVGEVAFTVPSYSTNPASIVNPLEIQQESSVQRGEPDSHFTPANSLRRPGQPAGGRLAAIPQTANTPLAFLSQSSSTSGRPSLRRADSSQVRPAHPNPLVAINTMPIALVTTRWIQLDKLLGRSFGSKARQAYSQMFYDFEEERAKHKKQDITQQEETSNDDGTETEYSDEESLPNEDNEPSEDNGASQPPLQQQPSGEFIDNGIDVSFLEAIPLDLRHEVLSQHFEQRRQQAPPGATITINPDFLASLTPDLRTAYLHESEREVQLYQALHPNTTDVADAQMFYDQFAQFIRNISEPSRTNSNFRPDHDHEDEDEFDEDDEDQDEMEEDYDETHDGTTASHVESDKKPCTVIASNLDPCIDIAQLELLLLSWYLSPTKTKRRYFFVVFENSLENSQTRNQLIDLLLEHLQSFVYDNLDRVFGKEYSLELLPSKNVLIGKLVDLFSFLCDSHQMFVLRLCEEAEKLPYLLAEPVNLPSGVGGSAKKRAKSSHKRSTKVPLLLLLHLFCFVDKREHPLVNSYLSLLAKLLGEMQRLCHVQIQEPETGKSTTHLDKLPTVPVPLLEEFIGCCVESIDDGNKTLSALFKSLVVLPNSKQKIIDIIFSICQGPLFAGLLTQLRSYGTIPTATSKEMQKMSGIFKMIDQIVEGGGEQQIEEQPFELESVLSHLNHFIPLWNELDRFLGIVASDEQQESSIVQSSVTTLLPLIEMMFFTEKWSTLPQKMGAAAPNNDSNLALDDSETSNLTGVVSHPTGVVKKTDDSFIVFLERYKKIFNHLIRGTPSLLSNSFSILIKYPKLIDFDNKRNWFRTQLKRQPSQSNTINLTVRRSSIFEDTFQKIMTYSGKELRNARLNVRFYQEEGVDAGGVTREFFSELARQIFNPDYALFRTSALDRITYQPNRSSWVNPDHLQYFEFVGRIIGKAIVDGRLLDCYFTRSFYKHLLGIPVDYRDMEAVDPDIYKSLVWILENEIGNILDLTFSTEMDDFGKTRIVDLIPNGRNIAVTDANKHEYVRLVSEQKLSTAIHAQIQAFLRGFHSLISQELLVLFDENELELLISGMPDIDVDDWKNNTLYEGYTAASPQIQWFWRAVRSFDLEQRAKLLQFTTGTSKVPLEGFQALQGSNGVQRFQIHRDFGSVDRLPSAHTCFNQLDLPLYVSYEQLRGQLVLAINECATGFGLA